MTPKVGDRVKYDGRAWTIIEVREDDDDRWIVLETDDPPEPLASKAWLRQAQWHELQPLQED